MYRLLCIRRNSRSSRKANGECGHAAFTSTVTGAITVLLLLLLPAGKMMTLVNEAGAGVFQPNLLQ